MRSEAEIRREIEGRLRRRGLLLLHGALWAIITFSLYAYARYQGVPVGWGTSATFFMGLWALIVGLHAFWLIYAELRDRLVRQAVERERQLYLAGYFHEKRKRSAASPRLPDEDDSLEDTLIDFPADEDEHVAEARVKYGR
jgi:hypothetical protein